MSQVNIDRHIRGDVDQVNGDGLFLNSLERMSRCLGIRDTDLNDEAAFGHVESAATSFGASLNRRILCQSTSGCTTRSAASLAAAVPIA